VTLDLQTYEDIQPFVKRPWFMVVYVDAPLLVRFAREQAKYVTLSPNDAM
jgi:dCMP deaminase